MHLNSKSRVVITGLVLVAIAAGSGCGWFRKGSKLYTQNAESRPLEVPPDLDLPRTDTAVTAPASAAPAAPVMAPAAPAAGTGVGFSSAGSRDEVFTKVGDALAKIEGVTIASRAQLLGAYDVNYQGSNFLVRVSASDAGAYVSAVDPRGLPASGDAPTQLIASLKAALGGN